MVSLQKFWGHFCGASLIGSQWILTAAHCVVDTPPSSFFAEVGRYHLGNEDEEVFHRINVAEVHTHVCYDGGFDMSYDVALVKLEVPVVNPVVELYDGADPNVLVPGETSVTVAGWGADADASDNPNFPDLLHHVTIPFVSQPSCKADYSPDANITEVMLCAAHEDGGLDR